MILGPERFEYFFTQLEDLLAQAAATKNPALFLYQNDARTKLFMLEGLSKLYAGMHNKKKFLYAMRYFKSLEDMIGAVDYYDGFAKDFLADPVMPSTIRLYIESKKEEKLNDINEVLITKKWLTPELYRTNKIRRKIENADWLLPEKEVKRIKEFYIKSITKINKFYKKTGIEFTDIELQVHDLRRKLRWLSIYPQALRGVVQLVENKTPNELILKYLTPEIVNSPFNVMPPEDGNEIFLFFDKNYFLALSFVISALGKLKDKGLRIIATAEGIENTQFVDPDISLQRAALLNHGENNDLRSLLKKAKDICVPFFEEKNLEKLIP